MLCTVLDKKNGSVTFLASGECEVDLHIETMSAAEAVKFATEIINKAYPFTRTKRTFKELDTLEARKEYVSPIKIRDPGPYLNQGCHRPGGHT
jgi:hypothetical protein